MTTTMTTTTVVVVGETARRAALLLGDAWRRGALATRDVHHVVASAGHRTALQSLTAAGAS